MIRRLLLTLMLLTGVATATTAQVSFSVIPPRNVIQGNKFNITFRLKNAEGTGIKVPEIEGCTLLYGPSPTYMQNYSYNNGHEERTTTVDYSFTYRADTPGTYTIGEARINVDGKTLTTKPASFTILPPDKSAQNGQGARVDDPNSRTAGTPVNANDVLIRIILNKSHAYEQEAILCTIKLYTKHTISSFLPTTQPSFDGFLIEELPVSPSLNEVEHYNGQNYMTAILKQCILFPQKSGKLTINSGKYDITIVQYERLGGFWGGSRPVERQLTTTSNSASIDITALPHPQPAGFTGAVGKFNIDSYLNTSLFKTNEAASLTYKISGTGNIKYVKEPAVDFPSEFEQYEPQTDINTHVTGNNVSGSKTIEYTFVPQSVGNFRIGATNFVYFNPDTKEYVTLTIPAYDIKVAPGTAVASAVSSVSKQSIASKNTDILHIKMGSLGLSKSHSFIYNSWWYWPVYLLMALVLIATVWYYSKRMRLNADIQGRRLANANKVARKRLKMARKYLDAHDNDHFYEELLRAIWGYLSDKLSLPASQLTRDNIAQELSSFGAPEDLTSDLIGIIDDCEMARYSPARSDEEIGKIFDKTSELMNRLENIKRSRR